VSRCGIDRVWTVGSLPAFAPCTPAAPTQLRSFNEWYDRVHVPDILASGLTRRGFRYRNSDPQENGPYYVSIWEEVVDEFLTADAKSRSGHALARLLNMTDGFIGRGRNVIVVMTTSEPVRDIQPALVRPGRCLMEVEFEPLSAREADERLSVATPPC